MVAAGAAMFFSGVAFGAGDDKPMPLGPNKYDYIVYRPKKSFPWERKPKDIAMRGDSYNDHFHVMWDARRRTLYAFWTQASWEGAMDSHICFAKSLDKGATWSEPVLIAGSENFKNPRQDAYYQQPMLSKSGRLYCLWTERFTFHGEKSFHEVNPLPASKKPSTYICDDGLRMIG